MRSGYVKFVTGLKERITLMRPKMSPIHTLRLMLLSALSVLGVFERARRHRERLL